MLRVNSPGGSATASEIILDATRRVKAKKPLVVSMGNVAASGGYYIAAPSTRIFAQPLTITGSIGVVGGKFNLTGLMKKIGVTREVITRGKRADLFTLTRSWTGEEKQVIERYMARTYRQFIARVSAGRKLTPQAVEKVAQGRIWSGKAAKRHKLVDELGGLTDAVASAKKLGGLATDSKTAVYPRPKSWFEKIQETFGGGNVRAGLLRSLIGEVVGPADAPALLGALQAVSAWRRERVLTWMPVIVSLQ